MSEQLKQAVAALRTQLEANSSKIDVLVERAKAAPPQDADVQAAIDDIYRMIEENKAKLAATEDVEVQQ